MVNSFTTFKPLTSIKTYYILVILTYRNCLFQQLEYLYKIMIKKRLNTFFKTYDSNTI